jgi:hypothetical protein
VVTLVAVGRVLTAYIAGPWQLQSQRPINAELCGSPRLRCPRSPGEGSKTQFCLLAIAAVLPLANTLWPSRAG